MDSSFPAGLDTGAVIDNRYRVLRLIGRGGMGEVFEVEQIKLNRRLALKVLHGHRLSGSSDDDSSSGTGAHSLRRFLREARSASAIQHRNVVAITDFGDLDTGSAYYVMELISGNNLASLLKAEGPQPWPRARHMLRQILAALAAAHHRGIIHRDIKPANVMLLDEPDEWGNEWVKVLDFGIAKVEETDQEAQALTGTSELLGTAAYMDPGAARGEPASHSTDLYAVGVVAYELLTGTVPFRAANTFQVLLRHINDAPAGLRQHDPTIPADVEAFVLRALAKFPEDRYASAAEMAAVLDALDDDGNFAPSPQLDEERARALLAPVVPPAGPTAPLPSEVATETVAAQGGTQVAPSGAFGGTQITPRKPRPPEPDPELEPRRSRAPIWLGVLIVLGLLSFGVTWALVRQDEPSPNAAIGSVPSTPTTTTTDGDADSEIPAEPGTSTGGVDESTSAADSTTATAGSSTGDAPAPPESTPSAGPRCTSDTCRRRNSIKRLRRSLRRRCRSLGPGKTVSVKFTIGAKGEPLMPRPRPPHEASAIGKCATQAILDHGFPPSNSLTTLTLEFSL